MALRLVENYGLTNLGITTYAAARTAHAGAQKHNFVVTGALRCAALQQGAGWGTALAWLAGRGRDRRGHRAG